MAIHKYCVRIGPCCTKLRTLSQQMTQTGLKAKLLTATLNVDMVMLRFDVNPKLTSTTGCTHRLLCRGSFNINNPTGAGSRTDIVC